MKVSIVIPTYKRPDYLERLLKSIENQTYKEFEVIIVDDNSPNHNDYLPVIEKYQKKIPEFIFLRNKKNQGAPFSRNRGILRSKYDLIALVDDDDEWMPEKLERQVEVFCDNSEKLGLVYTWTDVVDESGLIVHRYRPTIIGNAKKEILHECFIPSPSVMVRKRAIIKAGLFDESFPSCQDWDMWTRIILQNYSITVLRKVLTIYHKHQAGNIGMTSNSYEGYSLYYKKYLFVSIYYRCWKNIKEFLRYAMYV